MNQRENVSAETLYGPGVEESDGAVSTVNLRISDSVEPAEPKTPQSAPRFRRKQSPGNPGLSDETFAAGRADALVMLSERFLAQRGVDSGSIDPYQVYVHVDAQALAGGDGDHSHVESGPELTAQTVRRLCCDAGIIPLVESADGEILNVGRKTRTIPPALKRALRLRDKGCRFPGCTQYRHTDAHHIEHWADGGETRLSNLITLCRHHHRLMHEGGATLSMDEGQPLFHVPERGYMPCVPAAPDPTELDLTLEALNTAEGLAITHQTGDCQWTGESMDWDTGIQALMDAEFPQGTEWHQGRMRACQPIGPVDGA